MQAVAELMGLYYNLIQEREPNPKTTCSAG